MENKFTNRIESNKKLSDLFEQTYKKIKNEYPNLKTSNTKYYFAFKENKNKIWISRKGEDHLLIKVRKNNELDDGIRLFTITNQEQIDFICNKIFNDPELKFIDSIEKMLECFSLEMEEKIEYMRINYLLKMLMIGSKSLKFLLFDQEIKYLRQYYLDGKRLDYLDSKEDDEKNIFIENIKKGLIKIIKLRDVKDELMQIEIILKKYPNAKTSSVLDLIYGDSLYSEIDKSIYKTFINALLKINKCPVKLIN